MVVPPFRFFDNLLYPQSRIFQKNKQKTMILTRTFKTFNCFASIAIANKALLSYYAEI